MYRCKECQAEYKDKVEYCECGNNTFDYIEDAPAPIIENKAPVDNLKRKSDIVSIAFFVICIALSALIWAFAGNSAQQAKTSLQKKEIVKQQKVINKNIPNINKIWDDTPLYQPKQTQPIEQQPEVINRDNPIPLTSTPAEYPRRIEPAAKTVSKPVQKPKQETAQAQKTNPVQPKVTEKPKQTLPAYNPNDPELLKYKSALRSALFSKFAVGSIQGSGTCIIEFSVNRETGKLENRRFAQQSDNKALNDSVYYMLMSVPVFNIPPSSYHGEKIRMKFYLNNGYYEISFV